MRSATTLLSGLLLCLLATAASAQTRITLLPNDIGTNDEFGASVDVDGDYAVVGAPGDDDNGSNDGAAYVYRWDGSTWTLQQKLLVSDYGGRVGLSVAISGDHLVLGTTGGGLGTGVGRAYVFRRDGETWTLVKTLAPSDPRMDRHFGISVDIDGDRVLVGAENGGASSDPVIDVGAAYVFERNRGGADNWGFRQKLNASDADSGDDFGYAVALDGDYALIGAPENGPGAAYLFHFDGTTWREVRKWTQPSTKSAFGFSVALEGAHAFVGARDETSGPIPSNRRGAVYAYRFDGNAWAASGQRLTSSDAADWDRFGHSVAVSGNLAVVGALGDDDNAADAGSVYLYRWDGTAWTGADTPKLSANRAYGYFGHAVALHGGDLIASAHQDNERGQYAGKVFAYVLVPRPVANLRASDGTSDTGVDLTWNDTAGEDGYRIYRDGTLIETRGANVTTYRDLRDPDQVHAYSVVAFNDLAESAPAVDVGRTRANGRISGDVKTGNTGVPGVNVVATPYANRALTLDGDGYIEVPHRSALDVGQQLTVEAWILPAALTGRPAVFSTRRNNDTGSWQLEVGTGSGGAGRIAVTSVNTWVIESPNGIVTPDQWTHIAYTRDGDAHRLYRNGVLVAEQASAFAFADNDAPKLIGAGTSLAANHFFDGAMDEVRLWNRARTAEEIQQDYMRRLVGDEAGLQSYWRMDRGAGTIAVDYTQNGSHGRIQPGGGWTEAGAPVLLAARTNAQGTYSIREISYGPGTSYTVTPGLSGHSFDPARRENVELNSTAPTVAGINFTDTTTFTVSGTVMFAGTPCATAGVDLLVNGVKAGSVQADGTFTVPILNPGAVVIRPEFAGHTFEPAEVALTVTDNVTGLAFEDTQTYTISGKAVGGDCNLSIGPVAISVSGGSGCLVQQTTTDAQGQFTFTLPALADLSVEAAVTQNPLIEFAARPVSLRDSSQVVDFIYRSRPEIVLNGFPDPPGQCGVTVLEQLQPYGFTIDVIERYGDQTCPVDVGQVIVRNDLADASEPDTLQITGGQVDYAFRAGAPNIVGGGQYPYQKLLDIEVTTGGGPEAGPYGYRETFQRRAVVEGSRPRTATFATVTPELPLVILRDPPGDRSHSFLNDQTSSCTTLGFSLLEGDGSSLWATVKLGTTFQAGLGFSTETSIWAQLGSTLNVEATNLSQSEVETCFTSSTEFRTNDGDAVTGSDGDVFVGGAMNITYALTDVLEYDESVCRVDLSQDVMFGNNGFATEYLYSEGFIRNNLIPRLEMLRDLPATPQDSVAFLDDQIRVWQQTLALNASLKEQVRNQPALVNRSFDGGAGDFTYTATTSTSRTESIEFNLVMDSEIATELGLEIAGSGASGGVTVRTRMETGESITTSTTQESTVGYVLGDDDVDDFFSVDVKADPVYGTPIFQLASGTSSCPWEPGSQPREGVQLTANTLVRANVNPDAAASFRLTLGNTSESGEARSYVLTALAGSNPDGAVLAVNGFSINDLGPITLPAGGSVDQTLTVRRGPEAFNYDDLQLVLRSACDEAIADTLALTVHFESTCSPITLAAPEAGWVVNEATGSVLQVSLKDYVRSALTDLRLQFAPAGSSNWQTIRTITAGDLPDGQTVIAWNTAGLVEGAYDLRVAVQCAQGTTYSPRVAGVVDRTGPALFGTPEPADGIWQAGETISALFSEPLDPTSLTADNVSLVNTRTGAAVPVTFQYADRTLVLTPGVPEADLQHETMLVTLTGLRDLHGNTMAEPATWTFRVLRNPIAWDRATLAAAQMEGALTPLSARIRNAGGQDGTFEITRHPAWLAPSAFGGTLGTGDEQAVVFTPDVSLSPGTYRDTVVAQTPEGRAPLAVELSVLCAAPDWHVNPNAFAHSMSVTAGFYLGEAPFSAAHDRVAAFAGDEVRGVATLDRRVPQDDYVAYLTVFSNQADGEEIRFQLWDASECRGMEIAEPVAFVADGGAGSPSAPIRLSITGAVLQTIPLQEGVTWISLGIEAVDMSARAVLKGLRPREGDVVKGQTGYSQYTAGSGWVGTLDTLRAGVLYKVAVADPQALPFMGQPVSGADRPLSITEGWNWIGYLPETPLPLATALASLTPQEGDLLKSQSAFAQFGAGVWQGSLSTLEPGAGYLLKTGTPGTLTYPDATGERVEIETVVADGPPDWRVDAADYEASMTVTGTLQIDGVPTTDGETLVAAFVGDEVRGVARPVFLLDRWTYFLTIYAREEGETVTFKAYDDARGEVRTLRQTLTFANDTGRGTPREPYPFGTGTPTATDDGELPAAFALDANAPNPFGTTTTIRYALREPVLVVLEVYDLLGRRVKTLVDEQQPAGRYAVTLHADDLASGVYVYRIQAGSFVQAHRMVVVR